MTTPPTSLPEPNLAHRFGLIINGLCHVAAVRAAKDRTASATVIVLWSYLRRLAIRFERLLARFHAGRVALRPARPARPQTPAASTATTPRRRLPTGFAWLCRLVPEATVCGSQLRHLLGDPLMADLLAAAPQAGRLLRPLCRMLGQTPDELPPAQRTPRGDRPSPGRPAPQSDPPKPTAGALLAAPTPELA